MPHDHLVRKQALLDYKKWIFHFTRLGFFQRGYPMILVKLKFYICLFLDKNGPGNNVLITIEVENKPSQTIKIWILHRRHIVFFFSKGLTHDFGQKMEILSLFVSGQNGPGNNILMIIEVENKPTQTIKIWISHRCRICLFFFK